MRYSLRKYSSLFVIMAIFVMSMTILCRCATAVELFGTDTNVRSSASLGMVEEQCPFCPPHEHSTPDHGRSSCHCPGHLPLALDPVQAGYFSQATPFLAFDPFQTLPEVYLSLFIPPQILV